MQDKGIRMMHEDEGYDEDKNSKDSEDEVDDEMVQKKKSVNYAAVRIYAEKGEVKIIPVSEIYNFDQIKSIPYDAYVKNGYDEDLEIMYEPAAILGLASDKKELLSRQKRWPKPNKRKSDVIHQLAQNNVNPTKNSMQKNEKTSKPATVTVDEASKKVLPHLVPFNKAQEIMKDKIDNVNQSGLTFMVNDERIRKHSQSIDEMIKSKDNEIEQLRKALEKERNKNYSLKSPSNADGIISSKSNSAKPCQVVLKDINQSPLQRQTLSPISNFSTLAVNYSRRTPINPKNLFSASEPCISPSVPLTSSEGISITLQKKHEAQNTEKNLQSMGKQLIDHKASSRKRSSLSGCSSHDKRKKQKYNAAKEEKTSCKSKKEHKKPKHKRKLKEYKYDTDDYNNSDSESKKEKLTAWYNEEQDEEGYMKKIKMFHLHYGVSVPYKNWRKAKEARSTSGFIRELAPCLWQEEEFIKKAVQVDRTQDKEIREPITPKKYQALKKGYIQYLLEKNMIPHDVKKKEQKKKRESRINKFGRDLGIIISQARSAFFKSTDDETDEISSDDSHYDRSVRNESDLDDSDSP